MRNNPVAKNVSAVLLLGHSNAGKSPVGELIEKTLSTPDRRYFHLDFGNHLRRIAAGALDPGLSAEQVAVVKSVMQGQLLNDESFPVAERVVRWFMADRGFRDDRDVLLLNGLPRHAGQAQGLVDMGVEVALVVFLDCAAEVAWERKKMADHGKGFEDRSGRGDGAYEIFARKVKSFEEETRPLVGWYEGRGVKVVRPAIKADTTPEDVLRTVADGILSHRGAKERSRPAL